MGNSVQRACISAAAGLVVGLFAICGDSAQASPLAVQNASFEAPAVWGATYANYHGGESVVGGAPTGWTWISSDNCVCDPSDGQYAGTSGKQGMDINGSLPGTGDGFQYALAGVYDAGVSGVPQKATLTYSGTSLGNFEIGTTYTLTVAVGQRAGMRPTSYTAVMLADGVATGTPQAIDATEGTFTDLTYTFQAGESVSNKPIGIQFTGTGLWTHAAFDNVRLDASVPEPACLSIFGGAALLLAGRRRKAM
jgi:hypothetical protein